MNSEDLRKSLHGKTRRVCFTPTREQRTSSSRLKHEASHCLTVGLILATCNADGKLYLYDLKNFQNVKHNAQVQISADALSCLSWNKNTFDVDMILIGTKGSIGGKGVKVSAVNHSRRR